MSRIGRTRGIAAPARLLALLFLAGSLAACRDVGLEGNIPLEQAVQKENRYPLYEPAATGAPITSPVAHDGRNWLGGSATIPVPGRLMQPVATVGGVELFTPVWSSPPHARYYARAEQDRWHVLAPVP